MGRGGAEGGAAAAAALVEERATASKGGREGRKEEGGGQAGWRARGSGTEAVEAGKNPAAASRCRWGFWRGGRAVG